jgi:hypothetical protein
LADGLCVEGSSPCRHLVYRSTEAPPIDSCAVTSLIVPVWPNSLVWIAVFLIIVIVLHGQHGIFCKSQDFGCDIVRRSDRNLTITPCDIGRQRRIRTGSTRVYEPGRRAEVGEKEPRRRLNEKVVRLDVAILLAKAVCGSTMDNPPMNKALIMKPFDRRHHLSSPPSKL